MLLRATLPGLALIASARASETIAGKAQIIDGDTLAIGETKIRLQGIDAPETDQVCLDRNAAKWSCGIAARDRLIQHIDGKPIECTATGIDRYDRSLAVCRLGNENWNAWMVRQGLRAGFRQILDSLRRL